jgi:hypothetical protein
VSGLAKGYARADQIGLVASTGGGCGKEAGKDLRIARSVGMSPPPLAGRWGWLSCGALWPWRAGGWALFQECVFAAVQLGNGSALGRALKELRQGEMGDGQYGQYLPMGEVAKMMQRPSVQTRRAHLGPDGAS